MNELASISVLTVAEEVKTVARFSLFLGVLMYVDLKLVKTMSKSTLFEK